MNLPAQDDLLAPLPAFVRAPIEVLATAVRCFLADDGPSLAATLAFYSLFSFAPLLVLITKGLESLIGHTNVNGIVLAAIQDTMGPAGAAQAKEILQAIESAEAGVAGSWWSLALLAFGATSVLAQLQTALNRVWNVEGSDKGVLRFLMKRASSLLMIGVVGASAVVTVVASGTLNALTRWDGPSWAEPGLMVLRRSGPLIDVGVSWVLFAVLFTALFRFVPDTEVRWSDALRGACVTAGLFVLGKQAIGWYLGTAAIGSMYGAAGSLAIVLAWIFYSAIILLFGAELTQSWAAALARRREARDDSEAPVDGPISTGG